MSALDSRQLKELSVQEYELRKKIYEAQNLKRLDPTVKVPEGYYISGEDAQRYREEVYEYNRRLNEYKTKLSEAWREVKANRRSIAEYDRLSKQYVEQLQELQPQREAFYEYIQSIGPPEPSEEARARKEAGMPPVGIPGPGLGQRPGSVGERLQKGVQRGLGLVEAPFRAVTDPIRSASRELKELSFKELLTQQAVQPDMGFGTEPVFNVEEAAKVRVERKPSPAAGTAAYLGSVGLDIAASGVDVATFEIRPGLQAETASSLIGLAMDKDQRDALRQVVASDPFRFSATVIGGGLVGAEIQALVPRAVSGVRQVYARRRFERLGVDESVFTPFERELKLDFPEETVDFQVDQRLFKRSQIVTYDRYGLVKQKIPYYLETDPVVEKLLAEPVPDEWGPTLVSKADSYYALPFDDKGGSILVRGKAGMKPFKEPSVPLPPRNEAVTLLSAPGKRGPSMGLIPQVDYFTSTITSETVSYIPAVNLRSTLLRTPQVTIPNIISSIAISSALTLPQLPKTSTQLSSEIRQIETPKMGDLVKSTLISLNLPKMAQFQAPAQVQIPTFRQIEVPKEVQLPKTKMDQIVIPDIPIPNIVIPPTFDPPTYEPPPIRLKDLEKPVKKKKKKSRKKAVERRVDPLKITFPKFKVKVPKI